MGIKTYIAGKFPTGYKILRLIKKACSFSGLKLLTSKAVSFFRQVRSAGLVPTLKKTRHFIAAYYRGMSSDSAGEWTPARTFIGSNGIAANSYESHYESDQDFSSCTTDIKTLAFYLPQFHTFPENDAWWGKGFTEWTNTRKALPRYPSHYQPREPHDDIGYYDLSDWTVLDKQAKLLKKHGLYGLCIYHYWFSGKQLMETVVNNLIAHPEIDLNFCLCWANENWTRTWDGLEKSILISQKHEDDDLQYIIDLVPYIADRRYIRIDGKPLIMVYRASELPDASRTFARWREWARENGVGELEIWCVRGGANSPASCLPDGADGEVEFPPAYSTMPIVLKNTEEGAAIMHYRGLVNEIVSGRSCVETFKHPVYRCAMMGWDCAARRKAFHGWYGFSPEWYYSWLHYNVEYTRKHHAPERRFMFVNAWNEWAEGTYLEPDKLFGYTNINTTSKAIFDLPLKDHFSTSEEMELVEKSGLYDENWYLSTYDDLRQSGMHALYHYVIAGWKEGRSPSEYFPGALYLFFHPELKQGLRSPMVDYFVNRRTPDHLQELCDNFDSITKSVRRKLKISRQYISDLPEAPEHFEKKKVAIHLHCFYPDMIEGICKHLANIPFEFDMLVSVPGDRMINEIFPKLRRLLPNMGECIIRHTPNRGRDIAPLLCTFRKKLLKYDYFCHIHTKKSLHTPSHSIWAEFIYSRLFPGKDTAKIRALLDQDAGIVYPPDFLTMREEPSGWGSNLDFAQHLVNNAQLNLDLEKEFPIIEFPQGSMFWARTDYLKDLLNRQWEYNDFPKEPLGTDGSIAHALERLFFIWGIRQEGRVCQLFKQEDQEYFNRKRYWFKNSSSGRK